SHEPDAPRFLARLRRLVSLLPPDPAPAGAPALVEPPARPADDLFEVVRTDPSAQYDVRDVLACLLDSGPFDEYRASYGRTLVCGFGRLGGMPGGVGANPRLRVPADRDAPV